MTLEVVSKQDLQAMEARILSQMKEFFDVRSSNGTENSEWLNEKEARQYLKVSKSTLQKYRRDAIVPFSQFGRKIMFKKDDLDAFLTQNYSR